MTTGSHHNNMTEWSARNVSLDHSVFILTGGQDVTGNLLLSIPTNRVADIANETVADLTSAFLRVMQIGRYLKHPKGANSSDGVVPPVAFLADLRQAPTQVLHPLVEVLEAVEHNQRGSICAVYVLKPRSNSKSHILKKLLGVKASKKRPRVPLFKIVLMKTIQELYTQIDMRHLTFDFSGTLKYSHQAWVYIHENVLQCIDEGKDLVTKLPSIKDRVDLLQEYEPDDQSSAQLQQLLTDLTEKYHHIVTDSTLPTCLTRCKQTLFSLGHVSPGSHLSSLHPSLLSGFCSYLHALFSELDQWNKTLEDAWRVTESYFTLIIQYNRHKERAKEIERKICDHYSPLLKEHPIVGRTLSQAELYRAHFTTTLYEPAKELLSQATEILEAMHKVKTSSTSLSNAGVSSSLTEPVRSMDISSLSKHLTISIQPFTVHMQQLQDLYVSIHVFHLLFEKALSWYKKVLKFLPESLLHSGTNNDSDVSQSDPSLFDLSFQGGSTQVVYMPPEWLGAVRVFLDRHPPPREEHINRLDVSTPNVVDKKLRAQARSLALRLRLLQRVLSSTRLPLKLVMAVTGWKFELFGTLHPERASGHASHGNHGNPHGHAKEIARNSNLQAHSDEESTTQEQNWVTSSNTEEPRNDSSGTTSQSKKSVNFDKSTNSSAKSSTDVKKREEVTSTSKSDPLTHRKTAIANRIQMRKNSKSMLRAKSVEFSFNSSSTDGSLFDYEKAVSRVNQMKIHDKKEDDVPKMRTGIRSAQRGGGNENPKYVHTSTTEFKHGKDRAGDYHNMTTGELKHVKERGDYHNSKPVPDISLNEAEGEEASFFPNHEQEPDFSMQRYEEYSEDPKEQRALHENYNMKPDSETLGSEERYIGLSYQDWSPQPQYKGGPRFYSMDDLQADQSMPEDEFESGIDTMDHPTHMDPYDIVVRKIKDISASDLPNFEKLRFVSTLIANSAMSRQRNSQQQQKSIADTKLSFSTFDLRERKMNDDSPGQAAGEGGGQYKMGHFSENPLEAVVKMKQNLAKSMENLSSYQLSTMPDEDRKTFPKLEMPPFSDSTTQRRYLTELNVRPSYTTNSALPKRGHNTNKAPTTTTTTTVEKKWPESYQSQKGKHDSDSHDRPKNLSLNKISTDKTEVRPTSETQSKRQAIPGAQKWHPQSHHPSSFEEKGSRTPVGLAHASDSTNWHHNRKSSSSRQASLSGLAGRTFISPSFLRPASSMKNISSRGQDNLTFDLMKSMNLDSEKDLVDHFEHNNNNNNNISLEKTEFDTSQDDIFLPDNNDNIIQESDARNPHASFTQNRDGANGDSNPMNAFRKKFPSFGQAKSGYTGSTTLYPKRRPWSISIDSTVYPVLNQADEQDNLKLTTFDVERLNSEAELACIDQEEVANSLRKTQLLLEEAEQQRDKRLDEDEDDGDVKNDDDDEDAHRPRGRMLQSESIDNGYGSWASKLVSARSTSSEGPDADNPQNGGRCN